MSKRGHSAKGTRRTRATAEARVYHSTIEDHADTPEARRSCEMCTPFAEAPSIQRIPRDGRERHNVYPDEVPSEEPLETVVARAMEWLDGVLSDGWLDGCPASVPTAIRHARDMLDVVIPRLLEAAEENGRLREALEDIAEPMVKIRANAEVRGCMVDGLMANALIEDANWLRDKARAALTKKETPRG